jgi:hypothetical protein
VPRHSGGSPLINKTARPMGAAGERNINEARYSYWSVRGAGSRIGHRGGPGRHPGDRLGRGFSSLNRRHGFVEAFSGTNDIATAICAGSTACAGSAAAPCGDTPGQFDSAFADGTGSTADSGEGDFDYASASGDGSGAGTGTGSFDAAIANGTDSGALAGGTTIADASGTNTYLGNEDFAYALGSHTIADAGGLVVTKVPSSDDTALVFDPFGTEGSTAYAGEGNFDLAAAFGDMLHADATEFNFLVDILPSLSALRCCGSTDFS